MPAGFARGEFSFPLPSNIQPDTTVQGTWVGISPDDADDKAMDTFDQIYKAANGFFEKAHVDVGDRIANFLTHGAEFTSSIVEDIETDGDEGPDPMDKATELLDAGTELTHNILEAAGVHLDMDGGESDLTKRHWYDCCHWCDWFHCKNH